jgi:hypothetical protein
MRKSQNDKTSLHVFAGDHYILEDFIMDDDVYMMQAEDAPYIYINPYHTSLPENDERGAYEDSIVPRERMAWGDSGATNLNWALDGVIKYFDNYGDKKIRQKSLLIETDAAVEDDPDKYFQELKKRGVFVYFLQIEPNIKAEKEYGGDSALNGYKILQRRVAQYGWKFYNVSDPRSLERAYNDVNKLEKSPVKVIRHILRISIFQRPLLASVALLFIAIGLGLISERFLGAYP